MLYQEAIELYEQAGHRPNATSARMRLGGSLVNKGDFEGACEQYEATLEANQMLADQRGIARSCKKLGDIYMKPVRASDLTRSEDMYNRALSTYRELDDERGEGSVYVGLGNLAARRGEVTQAIAMWTAASQKYRKLGGTKQAQEIDLAMKQLWVGGRPKVA